jgi:hypothetical protein
MSKMNKPLANYYHEARAQVKKLKTMQEENKKRAERRAEIIAPVVSSSSSSRRLGGGRINLQVILGQPFAQPSLWG